MHKSLLGTLLWRQESEILVTSSCDCCVLRLLFLVLFLTPVDMVGMGGGGGILVLLLNMSLCISVFLVHRDLIQQTETSYYNYDRVNGAKRRWLSKGFLRFKLQFERIFVVGNPYLWKKAESLLPNVDKTTALANTMPAPIHMRIVSNDIEKYILLSSVMVYCKLSTNIQYPVMYL